MPNNAEKAKDLLLEMLNAFDNRQYHEFELKMAKLAELVEIGLNVEEMTKMLQNRSNFSKNEENKSNSQKSEKTENVEYPKSRKNDYLQIRPYKA